MAEKAERSPKSLERFYLPLLLFLYVLIRLPLLFSPLEDITYELTRGAIAHDLIHGLKLPFLDYTADTYGLGSLVAALWTVPFFKLLGENVFALKLAPFCWHFFSLLVWYYLWKSCFSPRKAFFISLFFVLPPPLIIEFSLSNNGYHFEMILWTAFSILLLKKLLENKLAPIPGGFLLGLLGGFSCSTILTNFATVVVLLFYVGFCGGDSLRKKSFYGTYFLGFCLGFSPLILFNLTYDWPIASFILQMSSGGSSLAHLIKNVPLLFIESLFPIFGFRLLPNILNWFLSLLYGGIYLISLVYLGRIHFQGAFEKRQGFDIISFGFLYQIFLMTFVAIAKGRTAPHYLYPMVPFIGMTLVFALERLGKRLRNVVALFCVGVGIYGHFHLIHWDEMGKTLFLQGIPERGGATWHLEAKFASDIEVFYEKSQAFLASESHEFKRDFYGDLSVDFFKIKKPGDFEKALHFIRKIEPDFHSILFQRLGNRLALDHQFEPKILSKILEDKHLSLREKQDAYFGFIEGLHWTSYSPPERFEKANNICETLFGFEKKACHEWAGQFGP